MQGAPFILSHETIKQKRKMEEEQNRKRQGLINQYVKNHGLIELQSDYLGMDSYYYDKKMRTMYKVSNVCSQYSSPNPIFEISKDEHILKLNSLI